MQLDIWLHNRLCGCITYKAQLPGCATRWPESYLVVQLGGLKAMQLEIESYPGVWTV